MTYKHSMTIQKGWAHQGVTGFLLGGLIARLKTAINQQIPVGYQDESGFHTGVKANQKQVKWPATW